MKNTNIKPIIKKYKLKIPVDLNRILKSEGIKLKKSNTTIKNKEGEIWGVYIPKHNKLIKNNKPIIIYSSKIKHYSSIRYVIAHQLSHYFLDADKSYICNKENFSKINKWEKEINNFTINLLIPIKDDFIKLLENNLSLSQISNEYNIPLQSVEIYRRNNNLFY